jgi:hypothetical protein
VLSRIVHRNIGDCPSPPVVLRQDATYASLDDADVHALAKIDPQGVVEGRAGLFVIDEIQ